MDKINKAPRKYPKIPVRTNHPLKYPKSLSQTNHPSKLPSSPLSSSLSSAFSSSSPSSCVSYSGTVYASACIFPRLQKPKWIASQLPFPRKRSRPRSKPRKNWTSINTSEASQQTSIYQWRRIESSRRETMISVCRLPLRILKK